MTLNITHERFRDEFLIKRRYTNQRGYFYLLRGRLEWRYSMGHAPLPISGL